MKNGIKAVNLLITMTVIAYSCSTPQKTGNNGSGDTGAVLNTLSNQQKREGWQLLFDGKTTSGWHRYGGTAFGSAWRVDDEALHFDPVNKRELRKTYSSTDVDIITDEEFENFHLKLEWKVDTGCNSGIMFLVHEDSTKYKDMWETGPEMQVVDNERHSDAKYKTHRAGDLYDIISCSKETVKPAGEWNRAEIKVDRGKLDFYLNGENVVSTTLWDENWKKLIKGTKWKGYPDFAGYKKGHIGLQDHGRRVWYRNIMIKKL